MESEEAPHVSYSILFYFQLFIQNTKYILSKEYQRSQSWVLECKLNSYWSKLRLREKHDVLLFSFFTCPLVPKTLLTQKSDSIFVHRLLRYSIFCCFLGVIFVPLLSTEQTLISAEKKKMIFFGWTPTTFEFLRLKSCRQHVT